MLEKLARFLTVFSIGLFLISSALGVGLKIEPFYTHFYLFSWWSYVLGLDSWLYLRGGESVVIGRPVRFVTFLAPLSASLWFIFEAFNLRLQDWSYVWLPATTWVRWGGNFLAFATVLPGVFVTANFMDHLGALRKNEFSLFFSEDLPFDLFFCSVAGGIAMLVLPLVWPKIFFPLLWAGFVFLLDPINAAWGRKSLLQEWRQGNWNRTLQLMAAGLLCGVLWEAWNYGAGAKWVYSLPLPDALGPNFKIFEMPVLGFLGFPAFALECFVMTEFAEGLQERCSRTAWRALALLGLAGALAVCRLMDLRTVKIFQ